MMIEVCQMSDYEEELLDREEDELEFDEEFGDAEEL